MAVDRPPPVHTASSCKTCGTFPTGLSKNRWNIRLEPMECLGERMRQRCEVRYESLPFGCQQQQWSYIHALMSTLAVFVKRHSSNRNASFTDHRPNLTVCLPEDSAATFRIFVLV